MRGLDCWDGARSPLEQALLQTGRAGSGKHHLCPCLGGVAEISVQQANDRALLGKNMLSNHRSAPVAPTGLWPEPVTQAGKNF